MVEPDPSWWDLLQPISHHPANDDGIGALARRIAGRSLGLVLGGGGARGLAHYGVYEELTRAGVVIDRFGGTSAGALAAATFALGLDARDATAAARKYMAESRPVSDYTIPAIALTRGRRVDRLIEGFFGSTTLIEHLPRGLFSVSTDLITGDQSSIGVGSVGRRARIDLDPRSPAAGATWRAAPRRRWTAEQPPGRRDVRRPGWRSHLRRSTSNVRAIEGLRSAAGKASASRIRPAALDRHGCRPTTAARDVASHR